MLDRLLTAVFKMHVLVGMRSCIRGLTIALFIFQIISWGALFVHNHESSHAITPNGTVVHVDRSYVSAADSLCIHTDDKDVHEDSCPAMEHALRSSTPVPVLNSHHFDFSEVEAISREVIAKRLEIVYLSHHALDRAPKQSPPVA